MRRYLGVFCKRMLLIWVLWSSLLTCYEWIRLQIPMTLYLYEEEAKEVLLNGQEKLSAEAKELLRKFDELTGGSLNEGKAEKKSKKKGFMDKIKETFED